MISKTYCAIIILIMFKCATCDKCNTWRKSIPDEATYNCYEQVTHRCEIELTEKDVTIHKPNEEKGTIDVEFVYEPNCNYKLTLKRWNITNRTECEKNKQYIGSITHSVYLFSGTNESNEAIPNCSKNATITLKYMYTGCYLIQITKKLYDKNENKFSEYLVQFSNLYFELPERNLTFSKIPFKPALQHRQYDKQTSFQMGHPFLKQHPNIYLEVECIRNCSEPTYGQYQLTPPSNNSNRTGKYDTCYINDTQIDFSCEVTDSYDLKCIFPNLLSGFYIFKYSMRHIIRCNGYNWGECGGISKIMVINELGPIIITPEAPNHFSIFWISLGVVAVGFLLSILCIIYANKKSREMKKKLENMLVTYTVKDPLKN